MTGHTKEAQGNWRIRTLFQSDIMHDPTAMVAIKSGLGGLFLGAFYGASQNLWFSYTGKAGINNLMRCSSLGGLLYPVDQ
jgi:hypothetical protein